MKNPLIIIRVGRVVMDTRDSQTTSQAVDKFLKLYPGSGSSEIHYQKEI